MINPIIEWERKDIEDEMIKYDNADDKILRYEYLEKEYRRLKTIFSIHNKYEIKKIQLGLPIYKKDTKEVRDYILYRVNQAGNRINQIKKQLYFINNDGEKIDLKYDKKDDVYYYNDRIRLFKDIKQQCNLEYLFGIDDSNIPNILNYRIQNFEKNIAYIKREKDYLKKVRNSQREYKSPRRTYQKQINKELDINKIYIKIEKNGLSDVVRIFEAMNEAGIISTKTEVKQIVQMFFKEANDIKALEANYNATKSRIKNHRSSSNSKELVKFIIYLCGNSFHDKEVELHEIILSLEQIKKNII